MASTGMTQPCCVAKFTVPIPPWWSNQLQSKLLVSETGSRFGYLVAILVTQSDTAIVNNLGVALGRLHATWFDSRPGSSAQMASLDLLSSPLQVLVDLFQRLLVVDIHAEQRGLVCDAAVCLGSVGHFFSH